VVQQPLVAAHHEQERHQEAEDPAVLAHRHLAAHRRVERRGRVYGLIARQPHEAQAGRQAGAEPHDAAAQLLLARARQRQAEAARADDGAEGAQQAHRARRADDAEARVVAV
jgi:hypothetical protein